MEAGNFRSGIPKEETAMIKYPHIPIIYIEDDPDDTTIFRDIIRETTAPYPIMNFETGPAFLEYLMETKDKPLIIFCDINMPRMSGLELRRKLMENEYLRNKSIPFIFFSTSATERDIAEAYELTVQGYFLKTYDMNKMAETMSMILKYWAECLHPNHHGTNKYFL